MSDEPDALVLYDVSDRVATITLNRPSRLNAFNDDLGRAALAAMRRFDQDKAADVAVNSLRNLILRSWMFSRPLRQEHDQPEHQCQQHG